jgi:hypothetical protein
VFHVERPNCRWELLHSIREVVSRETKLWRRESSIRAVTRPCLSARIAFVTDGGSDSRPLRRCDSKGSGVGCRPLLICSQRVFVVRLAVRIQDSRPRNHLYSSELMTKPLSSFG